MVRRIGIFSNTLVLDNDPCAWLDAVRPTHNLTNSASTKLPRPNGSLQDR